MMLATDGKRNKDKLINNILLWIDTRGYTSNGQPVKAYIHQLCADIGCHLEDLWKVMGNRDK